MRKLHVAQVVESCSAGVGRHVMDLTAELLKEGHTVRLYYSTSRVDKRFESSLSACREMPGFSEHLIETGRDLRLSDLRTAWQLRGHIHASSPFDIVHCHSTKAGLIARGALAGTGPMPVYTPHAPITMDLSMPRPVRLLAAGLEAALARISSRVIAVSETEKRHLESIGVPSRKLRIISNGVDPVPACEIIARRRLGRASLGLLDSDLCIGAVGRLEPQKNPELLIRAFARLRTSARLVVVGAGTMAASLRSLGESLGVADRIHWVLTGSGEHWMPAFDLFALSSRYEGQPYVLLEAMAAGLPVVSTRIGGSEIVEDARGGLVTPSGCPDAFAGALEALANDPARRREMGARSLEAIRSHSINTMAAKTLAVYREAMEENIANQDLVCLTSEIK